MNVRSLLSRWLRLLALVAMATPFPFSATAVRGGETEAVESRLGAAAKYLASDELEGRGVGTQGLNKAADYIAAELSKAGLSTAVVDGAPFQSFEITTKAELGPRDQNRLAFVHAAGEEGKRKRIEFELGKDFTSLALGGSVAVQAPLVFAGYGITAPEHKYDDYAGIDVKGKVVIVLRKEPQQGDEKSVFNGKSPSAFAPFTAKIANAFQHGAAAVILVNDRYGLDEEKKTRERQWLAALDKLNQERDAFQKLKEPSAEDWKKHRTSVTNLSQLLSKLDEQLSGDGDALLPTDGAGFTSPQRKLAVFFAKRERINEIVRAATGHDLSALEDKIDGSLQPVSQPLEGWSVEAESNVKHVKADVKNVLATIPGSGPLAQETIVVGAHYDHVGLGGAGSGSLAPWTSDVHNGADDNASGVATMLEVARTLANRPRSNARRIVFMAFSGEEKGLLGSEHYTKNPIFPLERTAAMVNLDMVGRLNENQLTVFGTGTSTGFDTLIDQLNKKHGFDLKKDPAGEGPSDHQPFYRRQIPVFHFFTGTHSDYHRPSDDAEKLNVAGMRRIADMVSELVEHLATVEERPPYVAVKGRAKIERNDRPRAFAGTLPDPAATDGNGCRLQGVLEGSPAAKAGIQAGDIVIQVGETPVKTAPDYEQAVRRFRPGQTAKFVVLRNQQTLELLVTFAEPPR